MLCLQADALQLWPGAADVFEACEMLFGIVFTIEAMALLNGWLMAGDPQNLPGPAEIFPCPDEFWREDA